MMYRFAAIAIAVILFQSCSKEEPGFDTPAGKWTYLTADGKIGVDFELVNGSACWDLINQSISVEGVKYNAEKQVTSLDPPTLQFIRINANDAQAVYNYNIVFNDATIDEKNTQIKVATGTYTWPYNKTNALKDIVITRP